MRTLSYYKAFNQYIKENKIEIGTILSNNRGYYLVNGVVVDAGKLELVHLQRGVFTYKRSAFDIANLEQLQRKNLTFYKIQKKLLIETDYSTTSFDVIENLAGIEEGNVYSLYMQGKYYLGLITRVEENLDNLRILIGEDNYIKFLEKRVEMTFVDNFSSVTVVKFELFMMMTDYWRKLGVVKKVGDLDIKSYDTKVRMLC